MLTPNTITIHDSISHVNILFLNVHTLISDSLSHSFLLPDIKTKAIHRTDWFSPPMYTHPGGYKFCLNINVEGVDDYLSVYFCQLKGEFDGSLEWPATVQFTLTLHNNKCRGHNWYNQTIEHTEMLEKTNVAISRPTIIDEKFVSHRYMYTQYACFGCLFFSVSDLALYTNGN